MNTYKQTIANRVDNYINQHNAYYNVPKVATGGSVNEITHMPSLLNNYDNLSRDEKLAILSNTLTDRDLDSYVFSHILDNMTEFANTDNMTDYVMYVNNIFNQLMRYNACEYLEDKQWIYHNVATSKRYELRDGEFVFDNSIKPSLKYDRTVYKYMMRMLEFLRKINDKYSVSMKYIEDSDFVIIWVAFTFKQKADA